MAGVRTASATGDPGSMAEINIRGVGSISASKSPLYVIDGVVTKADDDMNYYGKTQSVLSTLNPEDIESMTVLKDAAAAHCTVHVPQTVLSSLPQRKVKRKNECQLFR